ncbi:MAG: dTDP-4-dehydrorhamnose 3,5-epimerase [Erysipelotrichaceae bacterium]
MKVIETSIEGVKILEPDVHGDHRGWFMETYSKERLRAIGIHNNFVQDNQSYSAKKGTLRGLHFQNNPMSQAKLVRCTRGKVIDVAVDIRKGSPTYLKWESVELSEENKKQFFIPQGFAHGFLCLSDDVEFEYKVDNYYSKECDRGIRYDDPSINVDWGGLLNGIEPILSQKDIEGPKLVDSDCNFTYEKK